VGSTRWRMGASSGRSVFSGKQESKEDKKEGKGDKNWRSLPPRQKRTTKSKSGSLPLGAQLHLKRDALLNEGDPREKATLLR